LAVYFFYSNRATRFFSPQAYRSANFISDEEYKLIKEYDKHDQFVQNGLLDRVWTLHGGAA